MCAHIGDFARGHFPVAAVGIAALAVLGLPAVVHDDGLQPQLCGARAFRLDFGGDGRLMEGIPAGIHGAPRLVRHGHGGHAAALLPPRAHAAQRFGEGHILVRSVERDGVFVRRAGRVERNLDLAVEHAVFLAHAQRAAQQCLNVVECHGEAVASRGVIEAVDRRGGRNFRGHRRVPVDVQRAVEPAGGVPLVLYVDQRQAPFDGQRGVVDGQRVPARADGDEMRAILVRGQLERHIAVDGQILKIHGHNLLTMGDGRFISPRRSTGSAPPRRAAALRPSRSAQTRAAHRCLQARARTRASTDFRRPRAAGGRRSAPR